MTVPSRSDLALTLLICVGLPLAAGGWWRYFSGYDHPQDFKPQFSVTVEQAPAASAAQEAKKRETDVPLLAWTTSAADHDAIPAGAPTYRPGQAEER